MASISINIDDMKNAIEDGIVPGSFSEDRRTFMFPTVESRSSRGVPLLWNISVSLLGAKGGLIVIKDSMLQNGAKFPAGYKAEIISTSRQEDGKEKKSNPTYVAEG